MTRLYGRALPGELVVEHVPAAYGSNYTLIAAIGLDGLHAPWVLELVITQNFARNSR